MISSQAWHSLIHLTPPELTHYYENVHPGPLWWLKSAVPTCLIHVINHLTRLQHEHPDRITLRDCAYDWQGDLIPNCVSLWIHQSWDIQLIVSDQLVRHEWRDPHTGTQEFIKQCSQELSDIPAWQDISDALHLINTHVSDREARMKRDQFGVIHGKKTTSHNRARPKLDPERPG